MTHSLSAGLVHALPEDLAAALRSEPTLALWEALTPIGRNEFICWVEDAKQAKTRAKRIARNAIEKATGEKA